LVFDRVLGIDELLDKVDAIDIDAVRSLAQRLLGRGEITISAVGDLSKLESRALLAEKFNG